MTKPAAKAQLQPAIILFGLSAIGKPRAGAFKGTDVPAARKAATKLGLSILDVTDQTGLALAAKVPAGRIAAHRDKVVPFVSKDLYGQIEALGRSATKIGNGVQKPAAADPEQRRPTNWDDIKVGDRVLAQDTDPADGWWQAIVVGQDGDLFRLRWPRSEGGRSFQKHRLTLGLICPGGNSASAGPEPTKASPETNSAFPANWAAIGLDQIVLAKEDGPAEQWWEAKTTKIDKDLLTLQWRDYPKLLPIVRPRMTLGLVHPNPKTR
jgi:hypothetical protein